MDYTTDPNLNVMIFTVLRVDSPNRMDFTDDAKKAAHVNDAAGKLQIHLFDATGGIHRLEAAATPKTPFALLHVSSHTLRLSSPDHLRAVADHLRTKSEALQATAQMGAPRAAVSLRLGVAALARPAMLIGEMTDVTDLSAILPAIARAEAALVESYLSVADELGLERWTTPPGRMVGDIQDAERFLAESEASR